MSKRVKIIVAVSVAVALAALAALVCALCFRSGDAPPAEQTYVDPVKKRMNDPAYVAKIEAQIEERKGIMKKMAAARKALAEAKAANADAATIAACEDAVKAVAREFEVNRGSTQLLIREQMMADRDANISKLQQKKGK